MGLLHRHDDLGGTRYQMREKLFAIGEDFWIETADSRRAFKVDGKALRVRDTFILEDASGEELYKAQKKALHIRDTMKIERGGDDVATIKKALIAPLRERFSIELEDGAELSAKGNILDHEYKIERDDKTVAEVSKRWFRVRETYGIEIAPDENDALILAVSACIDEMAQH
ncbi:MAG: LURP-one-related/scramblase family protein [Solirubrobacteraceae bacterium]